MRKRALPAALVVAAGEPVAVQHVQDVVLNSSSPIRWFLPCAFPPAVVTGGRVDVGGGAGAGGGFPAPAGPVAGGVELVVDPRDHQDVERFLSAPDVSATAGLVPCAAPGLFLRPGEDPPVVVGAGGACWLLASTSARTSEPATPSTCPEKAATWRSQSTGADGECTGPWSRHDAWGYWVPSATVMALYPLS